MSLRIIRAGYARAARIAGAFHTREPALFPDDWECIFRTGAGARAFLFGTVNSIILWREINLVVRELRVMMLLNFCLKSPERVCVIRVLKDITMRRVSNFYS